MFANNVQPSLLSIFSSVGSDPLVLFATHTDPDLLADSHITFIHDDSTMPVLEDQSLDGKDLVSPEDAEGSQGNIMHPVLNIQSPTLATTYIRSPPSLHQQLGVKLPWLHVQVRNLGRPWSIEFGLVDPGGKSGVVRCSTFQKRPILYSSNPPLLHIPLSFPPLPTASHDSNQISGSLTSWATVSINLPSLVPYFASSSLLRPPGEGEEPSRMSPYPTRFASVSYVQVYATCRLRRIWFSEFKESEGIRGAWELELYGKS